LLSRSYTNPTFHSPTEESTSSSNLNKYLGKTGKSFVKHEIIYVRCSIFSFIFAKLVVTGVGFLVSFDLLYAWYRNRSNIRLINNTVEKGTRPNVKISEDKLVPRPVILERLKQFFSLMKNNHFIIWSTENTVPGKPH
jgi:hypothetical protein